MSDSPADSGFALTERIAVVTGGASGIGAACAQRLAEVGATVVVWDIDPRADVRCDVSDAASVDRAMQRTCEEFGRPTVAITSAGGGSGDLLVDADVDEWDRIFALNVRGTMLVFRALARAAAENDSDAVGADSTGGSFVAISSVNSVLADRGVAAYGSSKAAVNQLVRVAAREFGPMGIRVNAVAPGTTDTPLLSTLLADPGYRAELKRRTALVGIATPDLIAEAAVGLATMRWVTGQILLVDGGVSLYTGRGEQW